MSTITTAAREYASRPADERFDSVDALIADATAEKNLSGERTYNVRDLRAVPTRPDGSILVTGDRAPDATVMLESPKGKAAFTHWSFGQLARMIGAPASYLRELPPTIAADCLNFGMREQAENATDAVLLVRAANGKPQPTVRAVTSQSYGRLWDADLYGAIRKTLMTDPAWGLPPVWGGGVAGAYRGDRDSFLIVTNGGSIVEDPSLAAGSTAAEMYRGVMVRNSEVGAASVTIEQVLFRYICGNHMLWGAVMDRRFKRRHVGARVLRDTVREINQIAYNFAQSSAAKDEAIIKGLIDHEIAHTKEAVIDELRGIGFSEAQATEAYARCEREEHVSPRSYWGVAQGATRLSQESSYQDDRFLLDMLAAKVLARGARLVTV